MSLGEDLHTLLSTDAGVLAVMSDAASAGKTQQNKSDEGTASPYIVYYRNTDTNEFCLDGTAIMHDMTWDIECVATDIDHALDLAQAIKDTLNGYAGSIGDSYAQFVAVEDHTDQYVPRTASDIDGLHIAALQVRIILAD